MTYFNFMCKQICNTRFTQATASRDVVKLHVEKKITDDFFFFDFFLNCSGYGYPEQFNYKLYEQVLKKLFVFIKNSVPYQKRYERLFSASVVFSNR